MFVVILVCVLAVLLLVALPLGLLWTSRADRLFGMWVRQGRLDTTPRSVANRIMEYVATGFIVVFLLGLAVLAIMAAFAAVGLDPRLVLVLAAVGAVPALVAARRFVHHTGLFD